MPSARGNFADTFRYRLFDLLRRTVHQHARAVDIADKRDLASILSLDLGDVHPRHRLDRVIRVNPAFQQKFLQYGVDIAVKSNVKQFPQKTRVIKLGPVSPPDFYELPKLEGLKNGTYC